MSFIKNNSKKIKKILFVFIFLFSFAISPFDLRADDITQTLETFAGDKTELNDHKISQSYSGESLVNQAVGLVNKFVAFLNVIFICLMVYAGFIWINSQGEEEKIRQSLSIIKQAIIGFMITNLAYFIYYYLKHIFSQNS